MNDSTTLLFVLCVFACSFAPATASAQNVWINEFHYDNTGSDTGEFVEVAIQAAGTVTLSDVTVTLYNGNDQQAYDAETADQFAEGTTTGGFTLYTWPPSSIQNGPDGIALDVQGTLIQFLCYEGTFTAADGPAIGVACTDVGVMEPGEEGESLQLEGLGSQAADFTWTGPQAASPGSVNSGQTLVSGPTVQFTTSSLTANEGDGSVVLTVEISNPDGHAVDVDVAFDDGASSAQLADVNNYATQMITFSAGASDGDTETVTVTLSDDGEAEGTETALFELQQLTTTGSAIIGTPGQVELDIQDNDVPTILITEIMQNPDAVSDANGEWFEVYNAGATNVDLNGWTIHDDGSNSHTIGSSVAVPAGGFAVLCNTIDADANGDFTCDYEYSSFTLGNSDDEVVLETPGGTEVDRVAYDGGSEWPDPTGASMAFTGAPTDDNNDPTHWMEAIVREPSYIGPPGDLGSPGTIGGTQGLPVELTSFEAVVDGNDVLVRWQTASETNNAGFEIQHIPAVETRDLASLPWQPLAFVAGHGTTTEPQAYRHRVARVTPGTHRFRLKQVDFDGTVTYSPEVEATVAVDDRYHLVPAYPSPFNPRTTFQLTVRKRQHVRVAVYDLLGRNVRLLFDGVLEANTPRAFVLRADDLASGSYIYRVQGETFNASRTVTVMK